MSPSLLMQLLYLLNFISTRVIFILLNNSSGVPLFDKLLHGESNLRVEQKVKLGCDFLL